MSFNHISVADVARVVQWSSSDGTPRVRAEHVTVRVELFAGVSVGAQGDEDPNGLWAMLETTKNAETLEQIRYFYNFLFCLFEPNKNEKIRVLHALLYGDTKRALDSTTDYLQAVLGNMNRFGARQEERGVRVV